MHARKNESGIALVAALFFAIVLLAYSSSLITTSVAARQQSRYFAASQKAQTAAESGIELAVAYLSGPDQAAFTAAGTIGGVLRGDGERAQRYRVDLIDAGADGADNDLDGLVDEADESDMIEVRSTGSFDGIQRTVLATLLARYDPPDVNSATYIADPDATLDFKGNAFLISGYDVDTDGAPTGEVGAGIGVNGLPDALKDQIRNQQSGNVVGAGDTPSVVQVDAVDLQELVTEGARSANIHLAGGGGTHKPASEGAWGTLEAPAIIYGQGDIHISGGAAGAGIMIINGNLTITGGFEWQGLLIVNGGISFKGGGGGKRLMGALVIDEDLEFSSESGTDLEDIINVTGTIDILFSRQSVGAMTRAFATYTLVNWREGPNPPLEAAP